MNKTAAQTLPGTMLVPNSTLVFFGDSITAQGVQPGGYVDLAAQQLARNFPDVMFRFAGAGVSGDQVPDLVKRLERDVLARRPATVVVYIGVNDVWRSLAGEGTSQREYEQGLSYILQQLKDAGIYSVLCTPGVIGERGDGRNELDKQLDEYAAISRRVAENFQVRICDMRAAFTAYLKQHNKENREQGILTVDGVHLNEAGNRLAAEVVYAALTGR